MPFSPVPENTLPQIPLGAWEHHGLGYFKQIQERKGHSVWEGLKRVVPNRFEITHALPKHFSAAEHARPVIN